jgi:hypothetical protein
MVRQAFSQRPLAFRQFVANPIRSGDEWLQAVREAILLYAQ